MLGKLRELLELANNDLEAKMLTNVKLHEFMVKETVLEEVTGLILEIATMWPDIEISASEVMILKKVLVDEELKLDYRLLRGFLVYELTRIRKG